MMKQHKAINAKIKNKLRRDAMSRIDSVIHELVGTLTELDKPFVCVGSTGSGWSVGVSVVGHDSDWYDLIKLMESACDDWEDEQMFRAYVSIQKLSKRMRNAYVKHKAPESPNLPEVS